MVNVLPFNLFQKKQLPNEKCFFHETFKDLHQRAVIKRLFAQRKMKTLKGCFEDLEIMVYNNLEPKGHLFCNSNQAFLTSRQNFEESLRIGHFSSAQGCTPMPGFLIVLFDMVKLCLVTFNTFNKAKPKTNLPNVT